jgi:tetratricopeptide (TPR) repeat protein
LRSLDHEEYKPRGRNRAVERAQPEGRVFVGRERELAELSAALQAAIGGRGALILLAGEPGIGKTRLADEFTERARETGALVLWGRCWEAGGAPTYWPWVQAVRTYLRQVDPEIVLDQMRAGAAEIAQMIPEVAELFPGLSAPTTSDPEGARFRFFDRMATFLLDVSVDRPILLILDDLQSADAPSLLLLRFVTGILLDSRILLLGLYRDTGFEPDAPLPDTLAELRREPAALSVTLAGLEEPDVTRFIDRTTEFSPPASLVSAVYNQTEGNPLFVGELVRLLLQEGRLSALEPGARLSIPASVREVIGRRLGHLTSECTNLLSVASVIGNEFDVESLARLAERPSGELFEILDEANQARVVAEVPGASGRLRFAHALIRETLYEAIPSGGRIVLHHRTGRVLESLYGIEREAHLAELAFHFLLAIPDADPGLAVEYAHRAGDVAAARLAFEEAARLYGVALQALKLSGTPNELLRCGLLLAIGDAHARSGDMPSAKESFLAAASLAKQLGRPEEMARAAIGYGGRFVWMRPGKDRRLVALLEDALVTLGDERNPWRVRVLARLACALRDQHDRERSDQLSALAVEIARELGDSQTLAYALDGRFGATWWPENPAERLRLADEMIGLAEAAGDVEGVFAGHHCRQIVYLELGEIRRVESGLDLMRPLVDHLRQTSQRWVVTMMAANLAMIRGRFREAEDLVAKGAEFGSSALLADAESHVISHRYRLLMEAGRTDEALDVVRPAAETLTWYPFFRCALTEALLEVGDERAAREIYEELAIDGFAALPRDNEWLFALSLLSPVCAELGDVKGAETLYRLQLPYADRHAYGHAEGQAGSVSRALGVLAAALGRLDDAEKHYGHAVEMNQGMGARPWVAHTQHDFAKMLLGRDAPGDRERASELLRGASATCDDLAMVALGSKVTELLASLGAPVRDEPKSPTAPSRSLGVFRREAEYWTVVFDGSGFRLRDSKGMRYLAHLLAAPGREIHALELVASVEGQGARRGRGDDELSIGGGDAGPALDQQAKAEYRQRLADLGSELAEAEEWNDPERAARLREERDFLARELVAAVGLGGRDRPQASNAERARVNVTRAIRAALDRIAEHSPELGRHLARTVRTGTFCTYQPDPLNPVSWSS